MTITEQRIKEMSEAGYPIEITHFRYLKSNGKLVKTYNNSRSAKKYGAKPEYSPKGGMTIVFIGNVPKEFIAECSKKDHFCFKDGTYLAVSRAYAYFKERLAKIEQGVAMQQKTLQNTSGDCETSGNTKNIGVSKFRGVLETKTFYGIVCIDPTTEEFIGYVKNDDPVVLKNKWFWRNLLPYFDSEDYTKDYSKIAQFNTFEDANKCLSSTAEKVVKIFAQTIVEIVPTIS